MKRWIWLVAVWLVMGVSVSGQVAVSLPVDFEGGSVTTANFGDFNGGVATVISNPFPGGINTSPTVGRLIRNVGADFAGSFLNMSAPLDFSTNTTISIKVYTTANVGTPVVLKVEVGGTALEIPQNTTVSGAWETLYFDFSTASANNTRLTFLFNLGQVGNGSANSTFYFDDIEQISNSTASQNELTLPINFEGGSVVTNDFGDIGGGFGGGNGFFGGLATVEANTVFTGNGSTTVGQIVRYDTPSAGAFVNLTSNLDFSIDPIITMKVYTTASPGTSVVLKMEDPDGSQPELFVAAVTTVSGAWETLSFDFTGEPTAYNRMTFLFDFNETPVNGALESIFRFDDIEQPTAPPAGISLPIDFEGDVVTADFANFDGGVGSVVANPSPTGINTSPLVGRIVRNNQSFSGSKIVLAQNLDFSTETIISMKVYTTEPAGTPIIFKLEGASPTAEDNVVTGAPGTWQSFEFDFTGTSTTLDELVFLFDANNSSPGSIFYFDDIEQRAPNEIALPLDFEGGIVVANDLGGIGTGNGGANGVDFGAATIIANPEVSGINTSATVGRIVRHPGSSAAGAYVNLVTNLNFDAYPIICMNIFTDAPVGTNVTLRIEDTDTGQPDIDAFAVTTVTGEWEPLCFVYQLAPDSYDRLTFLFDLGNVGDASASSTFLFDDVEQFITPPFFDFTPGSQFFCPPNSFTFILPGPGSFNWYDDPAATNLVGMGLTFTTPVLNGTTAYYVRSTASVPLPQTDVGPTALGPAQNLVAPQSATLNFTSNSVNGFWHGVDVVSQFISPTAANCRYTVTGHNVSTGTSEFILRDIPTNVPANASAKQEYTFPTPVPMSAGDQMQLEVSVDNFPSGIGCQLVSFFLVAGPTIPSYPSTTSGGELTFTGYNSPGFVDNRWMGFDYRISGDVVDPTIYQVNAIADCPNPLPIELIDFTVKEDNGHALLQWSTASELNNDVFLLLRTTDGIEYEMVGTVSGAGNSSTVLNYSFRDRNPLKGLSYYKLRQVDFDGTAMDSEPVAYTNDASGGFQLFPNPTSRELTLILSEGHDNIEVRVYDLSGRLINQHTFGATDNLSFELQGNPGTYFVEVVADEKRKAMFNVLKL
jgi:hypothetical protein